MVIQHGSIGGKLRDSFASFCLFTFSVNELLNLVESCLQIVINMHYFLRMALSAHYLHCRVLNNQLMALITHTHDTQSNNALIN